MRFLRSLLPSVLVLGAGIAEAASSWNFDEAIISVSGKGAASAFKDKYVATSPCAGLNCSLHTDGTGADYISADYPIMFPSRKLSNLARQIPSKSS